MNDTYKLRSVGGALMVTIPQRIARQMHLSPGDEVKIAVMVGHAVTIKPVKPTTKGKSK